MMDRLTAAAHQMSEGGRKETLTDGACDHQSGRQAFVCLSFVCLVVHRGLCRAELINPMPHLCRIL